MANTKKSLRIMPTLALDSCVNVANEADPITFTDMGTQVVASSGKMGNSVDDNYSAGVAQVITVTYPANDTTLSLTVIDVTGGREKFPRRTFTGTTRTELVSESNGKEILSGDGQQISVATTSTADQITVSMPAGRLFRVAANDGATIAVTTPAVLPSGYTNAQAVAYAKDFMADQYGRTNRVGFPVIEPATELAEALGSGTYDLIVVTKVSEVKFDKNQGNSYQDVEEFHFLMPTDIFNTITKK